MQTAAAGIAKYNELR